MEFRIYMKELKEMLNSKDHHSNRTVKRWCKNNNVAFYQDAGSNKPYVFREEFERVYFKQKVDSRNSEFLKSKMNFFPRMEKLKVEKSKSFIPQGEHEKAYLSMLQNIIHKI
jgi:hypothetical protein